MLSKKAINMLKILRKSEKWFYQRQLESFIPDFDYSSFDALVAGGYIDRYVDDTDIVDVDGYGDPVYPVQYRISDKGAAYLEHLSSERWGKIRSWLAILISFFALIVSVVALIRPVA